MKRITSCFVQSFLVVLVVFTFIAPHGSAQSAQGSESIQLPNKEKKEEKTLEEVVVTGEKINRPAYKNFPSAVNVVSAEDIENAKPMDATEVLRRVPGVNYIDEDGRGLRPNIGLRGLDPSRSRNVLILADGFPVQPSIYGDPAAYYNVPIETADHIEVIKGGSSLLYGANALGGVINYVTKKPSKKPFEIENKETGGDDNFFSSETRVSGTQGKYGYMASFLRKQGEGFRESDGFSVYDGNTYFGYEIDDHQKLLWRTYWYYEDSETPGGLTRTQYDQDLHQSQYSDDDFEGRRISTNLAYLNELDEKQNLEAYFNYNFFSRDWFIARATTTNQQVKRDFNVFGFGAKYHLDYDLFGMKGNRFTFGNEYYFDKEDDIQENGATRTSRSGTRVTDNDLTTFAYAFYGVTDLHLTDRFTLSPILRVDSVRSGLENNLLLRGNHSTDVAWSPGIGADYAIGEASHLYASYHESFQPAEFKEAVDPTSGTVNDLASQHGKHYEMGYKSQPTEWLSYDLSTFLFYFDNEIITEGSAKTNGQASRHAGIEGATSLGLIRWVEHFLGWKAPEFLDDLNMDFSFTLLDTNLQKGPNKGNELPYAPNWHLNWGINYKHPKGFYSNLNAEWVDEQYSSGNNSRVESVNGRTGPIPSHKVWNMNLGYKFNDNYEVFFAIKNLFDEKYFTRRDTFFTGITPSPDRQLYGGVKIKF